MKSQLVYFVLIGVAVLTQTSLALKEEDCEGAYKPVVFSISVNVHLFSPI